jgi:hypothetical protein
MIRIWLLIIISWILMSIAHERDIVRTCNEQGDSGNAMWTATIECKEIKGDSK